MRLFFLPLRAFVVVPVLLVLTGGLLLSPPSRAEEDDVEGRKAELRRLKQQISALQQGLREKQAKLDKEDAVLREVDLRIDDINRKLRDLEGRKTAVLAEMETLRERRQQTLAELDREQEQLAGQMRAAYISGNEEYLKLLLNQQDPSTMSRMLSYYRYLTRDRVRTIARINAYLEELRRLEAEFASRSAELDAVIESQRQRWQSLDVAYREQLAAVKRLRSSIDEESSAIARLREDEKSLRELIARLQSVIEELLEDERRMDAFRDHRGSLAMPARARVAASFGSRRRHGNLRWNGILLRGEAGSDIKAVYNGRVVYADWMRGFGLLLILDHGDGYMSLYGHNESLLVEEGDWVETGQAIATMGMSGGGTRPGLYFEIRYKGKPQDPMRWCRR